MNKAEFVFNKLAYELSLYEKAQAKDRVNRGLAGKGLHMTKEDAERNRAFNEYMSKLRRSKNRANSCYKKQASTKFKVQLTNDKGKKTVTMYDMDMSNLKKRIAVARKGGMSAGKIQKI